MLLRRCMMIDRHLPQVLALGLGLPVLLGACATSPPRPEGQVEVLTTAKGAPLAGADCTVETGGGSWKLTTPATVNVGEPRGDLRVVCNRSGYRTSEVQIRVPASGYVPGSTRVGVGVGSGWGVHSGVGLSLGFGFPLSGGRARYPAQVVVEMNAEPVLPASPPPASNSPNP